MLSQFKTHCALVIHPDLELNMRALILESNNSPLSSWSRGRRGTPGSRWGCSERCKQTLCRAACPLCSRIFCRSQVRGQRLDKQHSEYFSRVHGIRETTRCNTYTALIYRTALSVEQHTDMPPIYKKPSALHIPVNGDVFQEFIGQAVVQHYSLRGNLESNLHGLLPTGFSLVKSKAKTFVQSHARLQWIQTLIINIHLLLVAIGQLVLWVVSLCCLWFLQ